MQKQRVDVSPEMVAFIGEGVVESDRWPERPVVFAFHDLDGAGVPIVECATGATERATLVLVVASVACLRLYETAPEPGARWHLPSDLRAIALGIRDCDAPETARATVRLGRSIELLCALMGRLADGGLVPAAGACDLLARDAARVVAARRMIDERWHEKLTLDGIARACGINRAKLTRGFRQMYDRSIGDVLVEKRLEGARQLLRVTDLPVSSIGYRCGYLNNASFTRAFTRRYGVPPTRARLTGIAA